MALNPPLHAPAQPPRLESLHTRLEVQTLGGMLGAVTLRWPDGRTLAPMYRAPWHGSADPELAAQPLLRHLHGDWLCAPFGPAQGPAWLPAGWRARTLPDSEGEAGWDHGWIANHDWQVEARGDQVLRLAIEPPAPHGLARVERVFRLHEDTPGFEILTTLHPRRDVLWPVALHPTFALPPGGVTLHPGRCRAVHAYPVPPVPGVSRLAPGGQAATLAELPGADGGLLDLRRLPLDGATEELLQLQDVQPPFTLRWTPPAEAGPIELALDWNADLLPDLLLWVSQGGRTHAPWKGRNLALGVEPCASCFDLTRVGEPAPGHPLAHRQGLALRAGQPCALRWSLRARVLPANTAA